MKLLKLLLYRRRTSHEVRGLKFSLAVIGTRCWMSHLTRGAWIEMYTSQVTRYLITVAPHTRCVDWNFTFMCSPCTIWLCVAPHTRCVDWNRFFVMWFFLSKSHLTRGAWIEIQAPLKLTYISFVAPHTRCVDWNYIQNPLRKTGESRTSHEVRGLKYKYENGQKQTSGRTSHEVRGLKYILARSYSLQYHVAPHTRCVDWNFCTYPDSFIIHVAPHTRCVDWN